jgi:putative endonuclease
VEFGPCVILSEAKKPGFRKRVQQNSNSKAYFVYIMSNLARTLYTGVTNNLERRSNEHKTGAIPGFTKLYKIDRLVYFQETNDIAEAIAAEKQIKGLRRSKKIALIEEENPSWRDLSAEV